MNEESEKRINKPTRSPETKRTDKSARSPVNKSPQRLTPAEEEIEPLDLDDPKYWTLEDYVEGGDIRLDQIGGMPLKPEWKIQQENEFKALFVRVLDECKVDSWLCKEVFKAVEGELAIKEILDKWKRRNLKPHELRAKVINAIRESDSLMAKFCMIRECQEIMINMLEDEEYVEKVKKCDIVRSIVKECAKNPDLKKEVLSISTQKIREMKKRIQQPNMSPWVTPEQKLNFLKQLQCRFIEEDGFPNKLLAEDIILAKQLVAKVKEHSRYCKSKENIENITEFFLKASTYLLQNSQTPDYDFFSALETMSQNLKLDKIKSKLKKTLKKKRKRLARLCNDENVKKFLPKKKEPNITRTKDLLPTKSKAKGKEFPLWSFTNIFDVHNQDMPSPLLIYENNIGTESDSKLLLERAWANLSNLEPKQVQEQIPVTELEDISEFTAEEESASQPTHIETGSSMSFGILEPSDVSDESSDDSLCAEFTHMESQFHKLLTMVSDRSGLDVSMDDPKTFESYVRLALKYVGDSDDSDEDSDPLATVMTSRSSSPCSSMNNIKIAQKKQDANPI